MSSVARLLTAAIVLLTPHAAVAHPPVFGIGGFPGGLLHPLFVLPHVMSIIALGLLIGRQARPALSILAFVGGLAAGCIAIAMAYGSIHSTLYVLALAVVIGLLIALARPLPLLVCAALSAVAGFAIAFDSPPDAITINEAILMQLGTFLAASLYLAAIIAIASLLDRDWQRIGMRIVGSWFAASAILVLAVRLAR